jgi:hypothetical protein
MFNPMPLTKAAINEVFEDAEHQGEYTIGLYKLAYPTLWDRVLKVNGYPSISKVTAEYIMGKAMEFDKEHHPKVMCGGLWLNNGFSTLDETVPDWVVHPCDVDLKGEVV